MSCHGCRGIDGGGGGSGDDPPKCARIDPKAKIVMQFWGALCCGAFSKHLQSAIVPGVKGYAWSWLTTMLNKAPPALVCTPNP